jgi:hypothetical protein
MYNDSKRKLKKEKKMVDWIDDKEHEYGDINGMIVVGNFEAWFDGKNFDLDVEVTFDHDVPSLRLLDVREYDEDSWEQIPLSVDDVFLAKLLLHFENKLIDLALREI